MFHQLLNIFLPALYVFSSQVNEPIMLFASLANVISSFSDLSCAFFPLGMKRLKNLSINLYVFLVECKFVERRVSRIFQKNGFMAERELDR